MKKIAIDFGSSVTKIYIPGCGVVLTEATCIAVEEAARGGMTVKAFGDKARSLSGRAAQNTHIVYPVNKGDIVYGDLAAELLSRFLEKVELPYKKAAKTEVIFILPCGIKSDSRDRYINLARDCGFNSVYFTYASYAAVLGHNVEISESTPMFSVDIGKSVTNIGAFSRDGMISGMSMYRGGGDIDTDLLDYLAENNNIKIGTLTAESLKNTVGSLLDDDNKMTVVDGRDISSGAPVSVSVNSGHIYGVIAKIVDEIIQMVNDVIARLPAEVASAVMHGGVYLSGGLLKMDGLAEYIEAKLNIPVNMPEEPQLAAVIGGGTILASDELLDNLATVD